MRSDQPDAIDLYEAGDHNNLLKTKSRHLSGQPEYLDIQIPAEIRTRDLLITNQTFLPLSYCTQMAVECRVMVFPYRASFKSRLNFSPLRSVGCLCHPGSVAQW